MKEEDGLVLPDGLVIAAELATGIKLADDDSDDDAVDETDGDAVGEGDGEMGGDRDVDALADCVREPDEKAVVLHDVEGVADAEADKLELMDGLTDGDGVGEAQRSYAICGCPGGQGDGGCAVPAAASTSQYRLPG